MNFAEALAIVALLGVAGCTTTQARPGDEDFEQLVVHIGAAELTITPSKDRARVHDDTYVRALVLDDETTRLAIVTADLGGLSGFAWFDLVDEMQAAIEQATGIPKANQMLNCSHTHNAPWPGDDVIWEDGLTYKDWLTRRLAEVVRLADARKQRAVLLVDHKITQVAFNRRLMREDGHVGMDINPFGPMLPYVDVLGAYRADDFKRIAVLFAYPMHPVIVHDTSDLISADLPGATIKDMKRILTDNYRYELDGVLMYAQGCGGNVNAFPLDGGHEACDAVGKALARAVTRSNLKPLAHGPLKARSLNVDLPLAEPPPVEECEKLLAEHPDDVRYQRLADRAKKGLEHRTIPYPMRAMAIGKDLCILSTPRETFVEYQLYAIETSPFKHTIVFGYTNGTGVYVGTKADYDLGFRGGYGISPLSGTPLDPSVEEIVKSGIDRLLKDLYADVRRAGG